MITFLVGLLHWLFIGYELLYPLLVKNYLFDVVYIFIFVSKIISWILCNDECFLALIAKQQMNKHYKAGDDVYDLSDMSDVSPELTKMFIFLFPLLVLVYSYLVYFVIMRNKLLDNNLFFALVFIYIFYLLYVRKFYNERLFETLHIKTYFVYVKAIFVVVLSYILYTLMKPILHI